jgi:hypothetical protein
VKGVVLEAFGVGNMPDLPQQGWMPWLRQQTKKGLQVCVLVTVSQCFRQLGGCCDKKCTVRVSNMQACFLGKRCLGSAGCEGRGRRAQGCWQNVTKTLLLIPAAHQTLQRLLVWSNTAVVRTVAAAALTITVLSAAIACPATAPLPQVYLASQCHLGPLNPELYRSGAMAVQMGVEAGPQMTPECAVVKMMLCLSYPDIPLGLPLAGEL